jgi:hypothetical protein
MSETIWTNPLMPSALGSHAGEMLAAPEVTIYSYVGLGLPESGTSVPAYHAARFDSPKISADYLRDRLARCFIKDDASTWWSPPVDQDKFRTFSDVAFGTSDPSNAVHLSIADRFQPGSAQFPLAFFCNTGTVTTVATGTNTTSASLTFGSTAVARATAELESALHSLQFDEDEDWGALRRVTWAVALGGSAAVPIILARLSQRFMQSETVRSVCNAIGRLDTEPARPNALQILTSLLKSEYPETRDSAAIGLALLDDKGALPALEHAVAVEGNGLVRTSLLEVIQQLRGD